MSQSIIGTIEAIAVRTCKDGPMKELRQAEARADGGVDGDVPSPLDRGISLLSADQWEQAMRELGQDLPWHTRRLNVLVRGPGLGPLIGRTIRAGSVQIAVKKEATPCNLLERLCAGLRDVLKPDCRGGVLGRITQSGTLAIGDEIVLLEETDHEAPTGKSAGDAGLED